jgi:hypothetical protein
MTTYQQIILKPNQIPHVMREMDILAYSHLVADNSQMGLGKTFTTSAVALLMGFTDVYVIATTSLETKWTEMAMYYGIPIRLVTTYQSVRSTWGHQPKHESLGFQGLVARIDTVDEKGKRSTEFVPTQYLTDTLATKQCLFIFDEYQHLKNLSDQHDAIAALSAAVVLSGGKSRLMFLSGSPFDKEDHIINFLKMVGIIRKNRIFVYHNDEGRLELLGAQELIDYCNIFDKPAVDKFLADPNTAMTKTNVRHNCYLLYIQILAPHITSSMTPMTAAENVANNNVTLDIKNIYVNMSPENQLAYERAIAGLKGAAAADDTGNYDARQANWAQIDESLRASEKSKWDDFIRLAKADMDANPNAKVIIGLNSDISWHHIYNYFNAAGYRPLLMYGKTTNPQRKKIIAQFQEHNNNYRILIGNLRVIGEGLDLDDKFGDQPRTSYGSPSYYIQYMHQFGGRTKRGEFTKSSSKVRFVYGKAGKMETSIIISLSKKGKIMAETLPDQTDSGIKFPDAYDAEIEPDPPGTTTGFKLILPEIERREIGRRPPTPTKVDYHVAVGVGQQPQIIHNTHDDDDDDEDDFYMDANGQLATQPPVQHNAPRITIPTGFQVAPPPVYTAPIIGNGGYAIPMTQGARTAYQTFQPVPVAAATRPPAVHIPPPIIVGNRPVVPIGKTTPPIQVVAGRATPPPTITGKITPPVINVGLIGTTGGLPKPTIPIPVRVTPGVVRIPQPPTTIPTIMPVQAPVTIDQIIRPASPVVVPPVVKPRGLDFGLFNIPLPVTIKK